MATITSLGIGSGLDVESMITKLMAVEQAPITQLSQKTDGLKTQLSIYGQVQSSVSALRDAASKLTSPDTWAGAKATSADPTAISVTAGAGAAVGSVSVSVSQLASSQSLASSTFANATATLGQGSITIELGTWGTDANSAATFTSKSGTTPVTINIGAGQDQLSQVRDQINSANAGVVASIVTDATGSRLTLTSASTGESNGFRVSVNDADGDSGDASGLSAVAYDPSAGVTQLTQTLPAANARALLNGLQISSESNSLQSAISGLNITLLKTTTIPISLSVTQDRDAIKKAITDFTTAYNAVNQLLRNQTKYDPSSKTSAPLQGDSTAVGLQNQLRGVIGASTSLAGSISRLADIGLDPGADGNLSAPSAKLDTALNDIPTLKKFFMGLDSTNASNNGFAQQIRNLADKVLGVDGSISNREAGIQKNIDNNGKRADELQTRADSTEKRLRAQYSALDTKISQLTNLSSYLTQQLAALAKNG
ncbi:MAG: flagellar filament capping protein FliD [Burkholderiales bacterium]|jgi:flagellar hook-associated protein 2|nr:flagellar filament capping protein FliD [Burkholderiales bacterium]MBW8891748.1 flagellar filament capping protein FliD [Burkholderiales bacterium]